MPIIKEIRKLGTEIKEVPKEKKVESIDDEFEDEEDLDEPQGISFSSRRVNRTSTLETADVRPQTFEERQQNRTAPNEDRRSTVNFYSGTTGGNPYKSNAYTPVGSAESSSKTRDLGERGIQSERNLRDGGMGQNDGGNMERNYAGEKDQNAERKRNLM